MLKQNGFGAAMNQEVYSLLYQKLLVPILFYGKWGSILITDLIFLFVKFLKCSRKKNGIN